MKIVVCVKQVPDTTEIKIDPVKNTLIRTGVPSILNPFDRNAVETALQLKDTYGGEVTVLWWLLYLCHQLYIVQRHPASGTL